MKTIRFTANPSEGAEQDMPKRTFPPANDGNNLIQGPSLWERLQFLILVPFDLLTKLIFRWYYTFKWCFSNAFPRSLERISRLYFRRAFFDAIRNAPAYATFVTGKIELGEEIPETDKESYIKAFPIEARARGGRLPTAQIMIDESSGSTGTPYNWVRGLRERQESHAVISHFVAYCFGRKPWITVNAFSMGAWATGLNLGQALQRNSIVKNTGPDILKVLGTLEFFGTGYAYLILGYPPFLKHLIDVAEAKGFPLERYRINALVGGEGMSEGLRNYLYKHFQKVFSGYGATDLEIGIAGETPLSVAIRNLAWKNPEVRERLFGGDSRLPMLFQYNPLMHYVEVNTHGELIFTITRPSLLSPRTRYNVHDQGGICRYDEMAEILSSTGYDLHKLAIESGLRPIRLPFLWVYGRSDYTVSLMGANIYPEDIEQCLYADSELARITSSYCLSLLEDDGEVRPCFNFEVKGEAGPAIRDRFATSILDGLLKLNSDFREAYKEHPATMIPEIRLFRQGEGPFAENQKRIKQVRFLRNQAHGQWR